MVDIALVARTGQVLEKGSSLDAVTRKSTFCQHFEGGWPNAVVVPLQLLDAGCAAHMPLPRLPLLVLRFHDLQGYALLSAAVTSLPELALRCPFHSLVSGRWDAATCSAQGMHEVTQSCVTERRPCPCSMVF